MGKVEIIKKSRKENKCHKCGKVIQVGSKYYKGSLNFQRPIIRCDSCKLESWEVTTSDFQLAVGKIMYHWQDDYDIDENGIESIAGDLQDILDDTESRLDNMPDQLRDSETGELLQQRIDMLESVISELESIDVDGAKSNALESYFGTSDNEEEEDKDYDSIMESEETADADKEGLSEAFEIELSELIDSALSELEF